MIMEPWARERVAAACRPSQTWRSRANGLSSYGTGLAGSSRVVGPGAAAGRPGVGRVDADGRGHVLQLPQQAVCGAQRAAARQQGVVRERGREVDRDVRPRVVVVPDQVRLLGRLLEHLQQLFVVTAEALDRGDGQAAQLEQIGAAQIVQGVVVEARHRGHVPVEAGHVGEDGDGRQARVAQRPVVDGDLFGEGVVGAVAQHIDEGDQPQVTGHEVSLSNGFGDRRNSVMGGEPRAQGPGSARAARRRRERARPRQRVCYSGAGFRRSWVSRWSAQARACA